MSVVEPEARSRHEDSPVRGMSSIGQAEEAQEGEEAGG